MILVGQYDSPFVRRVAMSLQLLGIEFQRNTISVFKDAEEMRRINPLGRIPSLILEGDEVLIDSAAILDYLDELVGPERALCPPRGEARRRELFRTALAVGLVDKVGAIVYEVSLRPKEKVHAPWIERCAEQARSALGALEAMTPPLDLDRRRLMQADIMLACALGYIELRRPDARPPGVYRKLDAFMKEMELVDAFQRTKPAADEVMPSGL